MFSGKLFDEDFEFAYERLRFRSRLTDFKDLQGYLSITVHNRGADDIVGAFLRVPGARFARVLPWAESLGGAAAPAGSRPTPPAPSRAGARPAVQEHHGGALGVARLLPIYGVGGVQVQLTLLEGLDPGEQVDAFADGVHGRSL